MTIGLPLLLALATSARTLRAQAAATAAIPLLALCGALTQSRGGLIAAAVGVVVFIALAPNRVEKLGTCLLAAGGSAALVAGGLDRVAIRQGLTSATEHHQATVLALAIVLVCGGVAVAQLGLGLLARHASLPALLRPSVRRARALLVISAGVLVVVALAVHVPARLHHAWDNFKSTSAAVSAGATHFGATSGEGRYQFWTAGVNSASAHPLTGSGPGTFQLDWLPRAHIDIYVTNAHSLYVETYAELGLIGLVLLVAFLLAALTLLVRQVTASTGAERTRAAAVAAALCAFAVGSASDWFWQMPVIPAAILLLLGACLVAPAGATDGGRRSRGGASTPHWALHAGLAVIGLACLAAIAFPLATNDAIVRSQDAATAGQISAAVASARDAVNLEPASAAAQLQLALALEAARRYPAAAAAGRHAIADEPAGWSNWLVLSRLYAEDGHAVAAVHAYAQAKRLDPQSPLFRS
jgi:hypothetical protein